MTADPGMAMLAEVVAALLAVLAGVVLAGRVARARGFGMAAAVPGLRLRGTLALDTRRRLHLVDINQTSVLVLTGGTHDQLLTVAHDELLTVAHSANV